jgi:hypothetical protein
MIPFLLYAKVIFYFYIIDEIFEEISQITHQLKVQYSKCEYLF